jgi:hypothetical protein
MSSPSTSTGTGDLEPRLSRMTAAELDFGVRSWTGWRIRLSIILAAAGARVNQLLGWTSTVPGRVAPIAARASSALLELAGIALLIKGAFVLAPWIGYLVAGALIFGLGFLLESGTSARGTT